MWWNIPRNNVKEKLEEGLTTYNSKKNASLFK
jgi:hypothetical protein